jgi:hypothetical protein
VVFADGVEVDRPLDDLAQPAAGGPPLHSVGNTVTRYPALFLAREKLGRRLGRFGIGRGEQVTDIPDPPACSRREGLDNLGSPNVDS